MSKKLLKCLPIMGMTLIEHHSNNEFCQATGTVDFNLKCIKMFRRGLVYRDQISN